MTPMVSVVIDVRVVEVEEGITRSVKRTVVVSVVAMAKTVSVTDEVAVAGMVEMAVVVVLNIDCGMLRQEQAVEMADEANSSRT
jgi:hypothetical protein